MVTRYNPSLHQELRYQAIPVIPPIETESLLKWLKRTGRLKPKEIDVSSKDLVLEEIEDLLDAEIYPLEKEEESSESDE